MDSKERTKNQETSLTTENKLMIPAGWVGRGMGKSGMGIKEYLYHDEKIK